MPRNLDFTQISATRANDLAFITDRLNTAAAASPTINTGDIPALRDRLDSQIEGVFGERCAAGGEHEVTDDEWGILQDLFGQMAGIWSKLDQVFSCHEHYVENRARFDESERRLQTRAKKVRIADGVDSNRILEGYVRHATDYATVLADCRRAYDDALESIQSRDLVRYHGMMRLAGVFGTREAFLESLIRQGKLVVVVETAPATA